MNKKWITILALATVGVALIAVVLALRGNGENFGTTETALVTRRDIGSTVLATGIIMPIPAWPTESDVRR